jgi:hypothetical protein
MNKYFNEETHRLASTVNKICMVDMFKNSRQKKYIQARMIFSYILREKGYGSSEIGRLLDRTHASVINYFNSIWWFIKTDVTFKEKLELVKSEFDRGQKIKTPKTKSDLKELVKYLEGENVFLSLANSTLKDTNKKLIKKLKLHGEVN